MLNQPVAKAAPLSHLHLWCYLSLQTPEQKHSNSDPPKHFSFLYFSGEKYPSKHILQPKVFSDKLTLCISSRANLCKCEKLTPDKLEDRGED